MTRVIHTGDTHIGYQQYNSPQRREDFLEAFRSVVEDAVADDVDAVVHAGDLFHDRRPGLVDLQGTVEILRTLADADIPFLAVVGNHESKRDAQWLDLFADLGLATRLGADPEVVDGVALYGLDFVPRSRRDDLEYAFEPVPDEAEHATLVTHGLFEPFAHADWDTEEVLEASTVDFDAVLLGDNHKPDTAEVLDTWVTYCGSTERASASEREDRGYNLVDFDEDGGVAISRRGLTDTREFVFVDVELEAGEGVDRVQERVRQHDLEDAVVIVTVEGEGKAITPATIEEAAIDRDALVARVNDRRELPDEDEEVSVSFADPDAAVRERVRELGLSDAARSIDETVRDDDLVDSNVRETVERRVRDLLEDDESAFDPAPERAPEDEDVTTVADELVGDNGAGEDSSAAADSESVATNGGEPEATNGGESVATADGDTAETDATKPDAVDSDATESAPAAEDSSEEPTDDSSEEPTDDPADADTASLGDFA
ncbi:metallophosphoesterase [Haloterrigena turkmenica DSM 5511]|uniref:DNA double-strand break repair protein Mre11 n=1 Tax=Haloterrigena turkmenica (strain ATCC 51198 / DSM 5511 / JCM 9101 / NCIMB 13204 / VKM B-1734 / 4k) TaxID=543526 RepID=D2RQP9_HALTV|nr:DNA double-strand break repair protein Mre11 [Haloterrigena turkmenica]ADB60380.1 metallophosphoesterase [Haloterrigena turkmenica DSM 5511]